MPQKGKLALFKVQQGWTRTRSLFHGSKVTRAEPAPEPGAFETGVEIAITKERISVPREEESHGGEGQEGQQQEQADAEGTDEV